MKRRSLLASVLLCVILFIACEKDSVENDQLYGVQYRLVTTNYNALLGSAPKSSNHVATQSAGTITWQSGSAVARRLRFRATGDDDVDIRTDAPLNINLFGPATTIGMLNIPAGDYEEARFTLEFSPSSPLQLTGDYNGTPIVFEMVRPVSIELSQKYLSVARNTNYTALTTLNLAQLLRNISPDMLSSATLSNGKIMINADSNPGLYKTMSDNMRDWGELAIAPQ